MRIVSRREALAAGSKKFYTGAPCRKGHDSERYALSGMCVQCAIERGKGRYAANRARDPLRAAVFEKSGGRCWYCGRELKLEGRSFHVDHLVAKLNGGANDASNLVPACSVCNVGKKNRSLEDFRFLMACKAEDRPYFPPKALEYLEKHGIKLPEPKRYEFWFERICL